MSDDAPPHGIPRPLNVVEDRKVISLPPKVTEAQLSDSIAYVAKLYGWTVAHFRPARTAASWATAVAYDGKGFPDLVLVHPLRKLVVFAELKSDTGKLAPEQIRWADDLVLAGAEHHVWRPVNWPTILDLLSDGAARPG